MLDQVIARQEHAAILVVQQRVGRAVARAVQDAQAPARQLQRRAVGEGARDLRARAPRPEAPRDRLKRVKDVVGDAVPAHQLARELVLALHRLAVVAQDRRHPVEARHLGAGAPGEDLHQPQMVHVLVGDHDEAEILHAVAERPERLLQLVQRLAGVGARVDERERVVLDEVGVDAPDHERGRDGNAMDALRARPLQRCDRIGSSARGRRRAHRAHDRISSRTSSRRRSMSSTETSDSRFRRSRGSVLDGRTLKCQSS